MEKVLLASPAHVTVLTAAAEIPDSHPGSTRQVSPLIRDMQLPSQPRSSGSVQQAA